MPEVFTIDSATNLPTFTTNELQDILKPVARNNLCSTGQVITLSCVSAIKFLQIAFLKFRIAGKILLINLNCSTTKIFFLSAYD